MFKTYLFKNRIYIINTDRSKIFTAFGTKLDRPPLPACMMNYKQAVSWEGQRVLIWLVTIKQFIFFTLTTSQIGTACPTFFSNLIDFRKKWLFRGPFPMWLVDTKSTCRFFLLENLFFMSFFKRFSLIILKVYSMTVTPSK